MIKWLLIIFMMIIIAIGGYFFLFFYSQTDIKNVHFQGHIYDKKHQILQGAKIKITNWRYKSDSGYQNYDEYLGKDIINLESDKDGYFSVIFPLSAFIFIEVDKDGYHQTVEDVHDVRREISVDIILNKLASNIDEY